MCGTRVRAARRAQRSRKITRNNSRRKPIWSKSKHVQHYMASVVQSEVIGSAYNETVLSPRKSFEDGPIAECSMGELFPWAVHGRFYSGYNP